MTIRRTRSTSAALINSSTENLFSRSPSLCAPIEISSPTRFRNLKRSATVFTAEYTRIGTPSSTLYSIPWRRLRSSIRTTSRGKSTFGRLAPRLMAIHTACGVALGNPCTRSALSSVTMKSTPFRARISISRNGDCVLSARAYIPRARRSTEPCATRRDSSCRVMPFASASFAENTPSNSLFCSFKRHHK